VRQSVGQRKRIKKERGSEQNRFAAPQSSETLCRRVGADEIYVFPRVLAPLYIEIEKKKFFERCSVSRNGRDSNFLPVEINKRGMTKSVCHPSLVSLCISYDGETFGH
jgi:hypothetical protein